MKAPIALFMGAALALSLAACGSSPPVEAEDTSAIEETAEAEDKQPELSAKYVGDLTYYVPSDFGWPDDTNEGVKYRHENEDGVYDAVILAQKTTMNSEVTEDGLDIYAGFYEDDDEYRDFTCTSGYAGAQPARFLTYTQDGDSSDRHMYVLLTYSGRDMYAVTYGAIETYQNYDDIYTECLEKAVVEPSPYSYNSSSSSSSPSNSSASSSSSITSVLSTLGSFESTTLSGSGDDVVDLPCAGLPCLLTINYEGDRNFVVRAVESDGSSAELLVNTIGSYSGTHATWRCSDDATMLEVKASGPWTITVAPMSSMRAQENGALGHGDDVVYITGGDFSKLTITHNGSSNFVVRAIGMSDTDLLVNTIGEYSGSVLWNEGECFLMIEGDGDWTVSW